MRLLLALVLLVVAHPARADRWLVEVEPLAIHGTDDGEIGPNSMMVVTAGRAFGGERWLPFVELGGGLINVQAHAGLLLAPRGLGSDGMVARFALRPQYHILCGDTAVLANAAGGYRWARGGRAGFAVLLGVDAGPAWIAPPDTCDPDLPFPTTHERHVAIGGQLSLSIDL